LLPTQKIQGTQVFTNPIFDRDVIQDRAMKHTQSIAPTSLTARRKLYLAIATQMLLAAGAQAAPTGGVVVAGEGLIDQSGLETTITQNTERLAIDWASFNVRADERVQFIQPGETSVALNRILGNEASQIFGRLDANGHVILMNPNGVLFGESATVNVGGLVASGLAIRMTL
jgi:filamentous hemagglutinin family protein